MNKPSHSYSMNVNNAAKIGGTGRINTTGPYEGVFTRAEAVSSDKGTIGIEFDFKTTDGATASFLSVWTNKANGEPLSGSAVIDALMLLLRVKDMSPKNITVEKWDNESRQVEKMQLPCFVDLMSKPIGLLLQKEISEYQGKQKEKMLIYGAYDIASRKTPREIVSKAPKAQALDTIIASLKDKIAKPQGGSASYAPPSSHGGDSYGGGHAFDDLDDQIPF